MCKIKRRQERREEEILQIGREGLRMRNSHSLIAHRAENVSIGPYTCRQIKFLGISVGGEGGVKG